MFFFKWLPFKSNFTVASKYLEVTLEMTPPTTGNKIKVNICQYGFYHAFTLQCQVSSSYSCFNIRTHLKSSIVMDTHLFLTPLCPGSGYHWVCRCPAAISCETSTTTILFFIHTQTNTAYHLNTIGHATRVAINDTASLYVSTGAPLLTGINFSPCMNN